jgi:ClpP class serine protease
LKGRLYTAEEALGTLIDSIGTFDDAIDRVVELSEQNQNNDDKNQSTMDRFKEVNEAIGVSSLEFQDGYTSLSIAQVEAVNNRLAELRQGKEQAENDLTQKDNTISEKDQQIENLQNEVQQLKEGPGEQRTEIYKSTDEQSQEEADPEMLTDEDIELYNAVKQ